MPIFPTFVYDKLIRDIKGIPLGRIILKDDADYVLDMPNIPVVLLKIPVSITPSVAGLLCYIDGVAYKIPDEVVKNKVNKRGGDYIVTNFYLEKEV